MPVNDASENQKSCRSTSLVGCLAEDLGRIPLSEKHQVLHVLQVLVVAREQQQQVRCEDPLLFTGANNFNFDRPLDPFHMEYPL